MQTATGKIAYPLAVAAVLLFFVWPAQALAALTVKADHSRISINPFYHGGIVNVQGSSDPGEEIIVKISSGEETLGLKKKGKVGGLLWMNTGSIKFDQAPTLYFLESSEPVESILNRQEADRYLLGYPALARHVRVEHLNNQSEKAKWFDELVKYQEQLHLYRQNEKGVVRQMRDGRQFYQASFEWPYQARPGRYTVEVFAVKDGRITDQATTSVEVAQVGAVKALAIMARKHGGLYGGLAILVALLSGFGVGMIFRKGGGAH